ncbi:MAG TPA: DUF58 domain-containing protein [Solirubrobacteraceae bacterium]|nr:DUF58 domain-containing protein [Solirubrobacteraceae bacterium]
MRRAAALLALGAALLLCAAAFASPSLAVPGVALVTVGVLAPVWAALAARGATIARRIEPRQVQEGEPVSATIVVGGGALPSPGASVEDPVLGEVTAAGSAVLRGDETFGRRGRRRLAPARRVVRDPLGVVRRVAAQTGPDEILVLPRVEPVDLPPELSGSPVRGPARAGAVEAALDFDGLGPYRPGAPVSRIHWAGLARHDELMERRFRAEREPLPLVVLDARDPAGEDAFEDAVRAAASLAAALIGVRGCRVLLAGDSRGVVLDADGRGWPALHGRLALVEPDERVPSPAVLAGAGAVLWVTAARRPLLPSPLEQTAAQRPSYLVTPHALPGGPAFAAAACRAWRLGHPQRPVGVSTAGAIA